MPDQWPTSAEIHGGVAERLRGLLDEQAGSIAEIGRRTLSVGSGVLGPQPHSATCVLAVGACVAAGADWRMAIWPAVGAECMMAAADLFDDAADADPSDDANPGVLLTVAAGLLGLAGAAVVRVVDDGAPATTALALCNLLGNEFARAANGQAASLGRARVTDPVAAYAQAAAKSGPLGALIARLGARTATDRAIVLDLLAEFGRRLAQRSQLLNDARDASAAGDPRKADVRAGVATVPLVFSGSSGAPTGLTGAALSAWEAAERERVSASGGLAAALALAEAERLRMHAALAELDALGCATAGLRALSD